MAAQCPKKINEVGDDKGPERKEPEQETFAVSWGGEAYSLQKVHMADQQVPIPKSTYGRTIDNEGFKVVKCRWNTCKGVNCEHIRRLGAINAVSNDQARRDTEDIRQKVEARIQMESKEGIKIGGILGAGGTGERAWFRETDKGYEVDLTIDSGAVATITLAGTIPG